MLEAILKGKLTVFGSSVKTVSALKQLGTPALIVEPGRSIVEDSGITLARVNQVRKVATHHDLVTLELGVTSYCESMFHMTMNRWSLLGGSRSRKGGRFEAFVGGNLCFSGDMLCRFKIEFSRRPVRGDIVMIEDTGAYASQFMACNANAFPRPSRVLVDELGRPVLLRKRDDYSEVFSLRKE
jgi:diaminopimelate decarboxylase